MGRYLRFRQKFNKVLLAGLLGFTTIGMNGCDAVYWNDQASLSEIHKKKDIIVLTTQSPLIYSRSASGDIHGIDYDLLQNFAQHFGLTLKFKVLPDEQAVITALSEGQGDLAAARLRSFQGTAGFLISPGYEETHLSLYCHSKEQIENIADLNDKNIAILKRDSYPGLIERLQQLTKNLHVTVLENKKMPDVFRQLSRKDFNCVIAETLNGDHSVQNFSAVEKITTLSEAYSLSWLITPNNTDLLRLIQSWYLQASRNDELSQVISRYKNTVSKLNRADLERLNSRIKTTLPAYKETFKKAAETYHLPWQLVAAVAYQESQWNPEAQSYTGVLGLMQLTSETATFLGVEDRTNPEQSIWGGAKYLRYLLDQTPKHVHAKERLALALAAYNVGWAHLKDAQKLAEQKDRNPFSWHHLRHILPLLADPAYAQDLEFGGARGHETVEFVERVKSFYSYLSTSL